MLHGGGAHAIAAEARQRLLGGAQRHDGRLRRRIAPRRSHDAVPATATREAPSEGWLAAPYRLWLAGAVPPLPRGGPCQRAALPGTSCLPPSPAALPPRPWLQPRVEAAPRPLLAPAAASVN
jgi:hypothetical protein